MLIGSSESQTAKAQIANYESFMLAVYLFNKVPEASLEVKKNIALAIRNRVQDDRNVFKEDSVYRLIHNESFKFGNPESPYWQECLQAVKPQIGNAKPFAKDANVVEFVGIDFDEAGRDTVWEKKLEGVSFKRV